jgi:hypothetical protein
VKADHYPEHWVGCATSAPHSHLSPSHPSITAAQPRLSSADQSGTQYRYHTSPLPSLISSTLFSFVSQHSSKIQNYTITPQHQQPCLPRRKSQRVKAPNPKVVYVLPPRTQFPKQANPLTSLLHRPSAGRSRTRKRYRTTSPPLHPHITNSTSSLSSPKAATSQPTTTSASSASSQVCSPILPPCPPSSLTYSPPPTYPTPPYQLSLRTHTNTAQAQTSTA